MQRLNIITESNPRRVSWIGAVFVVLVFALSFTFVFERSSRPQTDEKGDKVYNFSDDGKSYIIKNGNGYNIYLSGENFGYFEEIPEIFNNLPIYDSKEDLEQQ